MVKIPAVLNRRLRYVGLVDRDQGDSLHEFLEPGQRLVSLEGDLWRWDGYIRFGLVTRHLQLHYKFNRQII